jgi:predicted metalloprotease
MEFDDQRVDVSGVSDRRGSGGGLGRGVAIGGGGLGLVGVIVVLLLQLLGGGAGGGGGFDLTQLAPGTVTGGAPDESQEQLAERCNSEGAIDQYDDCYLIKVYNETDEVWSEELAPRGGEYRPPGLTFFTQAVNTGCGQATSQVGPFYCPPDENIYIDIDFLEQLQQRFGADGRYAQAYIMAHEFGHHLQTILGVEPQVRQAQQANPSQQNDLSVRLELQADCFAGVWGRLADDRGNVTITRAELTQALEAAAAVGDDRIQEAATGRVDPESFTPGSAQQRQEWYTRGFDTGDIQQCDTFA